MAKGTRVSDVNFSVPEGADPMGIGIPDLGKSSYDPIATIQRGWAKDREDRKMKSAERREDWKAQKKAIPTFESVNANIAGILNKKAMQLGSLVDQKYKSGMFAPFARTGERDDDGKRKKSWQEIQRLEGELASEGEAYNRLIPNYAVAEKISNDPNNEKTLDYEYTQRKMAEFANAKSVEEMAAVGTKLYAFKPTPVKMMEEVTTRLEDYVPQEVIERLKPVWNPELRKMEVTQLTGKDKKLVDQALGYIHRDLGFEEDEFTNDSRSRYEKAPQSEKVDENGVAIDEQVWFRRRYGKLLGIPTESVSYITPTKVSTESGKKEFDWNSMITIPKDEKGLYQFPDEESTEIASYNEESEKTVKKQYDVAATVELSGVSDKVFAVKTTSNVTDQQIGKKIPEGMIVFEQPVINQLLPVASSDIKFGGKTIKKGERIDKELYNQQDFPQDKAGWDWFTTSNSQLKKAQDKYQDLGAGYNLTTVRPWREIRDALVLEVSEKFDIKNLDKELEEIKRQKNAQRGQKTEAQKKKEQDKIVDDILQGAFKIGT